MTTRDTRAVFEIAAAHHGVFTRAQAADQKLTESMLRTMVRRGVVDRVRPNVFVVTGSRPTWERALVIATLAGNGAVASHRSSARLYRVDGFARMPIVEVSVVRGRYPAADGVVVHRTRELKPADVVIVDGIATTSLARTLCDLGAVVDVDLLEQALDDVLRRGCSRRWIDQTMARLERPGPTGLPQLRRLLDSPARGGPIPDSWRERVTERMLCHPDLAGLVRQYRLVAADGTEVARFDFAMLDAQVGIEYHSDQWHYGPRRGRRDRRRDLAASRLGWEIVYLDSSDHEHPADAVTAVLDIVEDRRGRYAAG